MMNLTRIALILCLLSSASAQATVSWSDGDVEAARARAAKRDKRTLVFVTASWCPACQRLKREVLDRPENAGLLERFERVAVDFDREASHRWVQALVILGLPTVVVLDSRGKPVGRIRGYSDAASWTQELERLSGATDRLAHIQRAARAPEAAPADRLKLARLLLERGNESQALALLRDVVDVGDPAASPEALFVMGRYHHRVKRRPATARPIWRELALAFPASPFAAGAWWWYARAEAETGHAGIGARALLDSARANLSDAGGVRRAAAFLKKHPALLPCAQGELTALLDEALRRVSDEGERERLRALRSPASEETPQ